MAKKNSRDRKACKFILLRIIDWNRQKLQFSVKSFYSVMCWFIANCFHEIFPKIFRESVMSTKEVLTSRKLGTRVALVVVQLKLYISNK